MLRDPSLIPLSRQHQHALALCVRLDRAMQAGEIDLQAWQSEIQQQFESEIEVHFAAEEKELFPAAPSSRNCNRWYANSSPNTPFSAIISRARPPAVSTGRASPVSAEKLVMHIRKEERQLFEGMQRVMSSQELAALGSALDEALKNASQACALPNEATRLQAKP